MVIATKYMLIILIAASFNICFAGENIWTSNGPYGASVITIAINPLDHHQIFVGTVHNGIYKSVDAGEHWLHVDCNIMERGQRKIVFHPFAPDTIYATTIRGIYKSIDNGLNWRNISPPGREHAEFRSLALDPIHPNIIIIGGNSDRWKSTDSGENWYSFTIDPHSSPDFPVEALAINPDSTNIIYLLTSSAEFGYGIFKSINGGETWFPTQGNSDSSGFGLDIAIDPANTNIIYYAREDAFRQSAGGRFLSKSTDAGVSWIDISPQVEGDWGVRVILISPLDHNIVFIGTPSDGVFKSTNGGQNWIPVNTGLKSHRCFSLVMDRINGFIYLGTVLDGIYQSTNGGESWRKISYNILAEPFTEMAFQLQSPPIAYALTNKGCYRQPVGDSGWQEVDIGIPPLNDMASIKTDMLFPANIYIGSSSFFPSSNDTAGFYLTIDNGQSWDFLHEGLPSTVVLDDIAISYLSAQDKRIFLAASNSPISNGIYCSVDNGQNWRYCSSGLPPPFQAQINNVVVAPSDPNIVAASDYFNHFFISTDRGENWSQTNFPGPGGDSRFIIEICFDPYNADHVFISGCGYGVYETTNLGNSWVDITNDLPVDSDFPQIDGLSINSLNTQNIFVSSLYYGVYQTHNAGQHWEPFNAGLDYAYCPGKI
jgi:photosystem II stability/assembly factor-like uncharacterized protein